MASKKEESIVGELCDCEGYPVELRVTVTTLDGIVLDSVRICRECFKRNNIALIAGERP